MVQADSNDLTWNILHWVSMDRPLHLSLVATGVLRVGSGRHWRTGSQSDGVEVCLKDGTHYCGLFAHPTGRRWTLVPSRRTRSRVVRGSISSGRRSGLTSVSCTTSPGQPVSPRPVLSLLRPLFEGPRRKGWDSGTEARS